MKAGGIVVARRARAPLLLIGGGFSSVWRLKSWDRFRLPLPFSRVRLRCDYVPLTEISGDRDAAVARLRERMREINPD